jgi:drug/metabolite transporter superfamily protein YnfA
MFLATSETLSQYIHMMLEAVDTIELSKTSKCHVLGCYLIALWQKAEQSHVFTHIHAHTSCKKKVYRLVTLSTTWM